MKIFITFAICFLLLVVVWAEYKYDLPVIVLPKGARHNTIGELPIVEAMDDGDFYEKDGAEEYARLAKIKQLEEKIQGEYLRCLERSRTNEGNCGYIEGDAKNLCKTERYSHCEEKYKKAMKKSFKVFGPMTSLIRFYDPEYDDGIYQWYFDTFWKGWKLK